MLVVERARTRIRHIADAMLRDLVMRTADQMPHGVTTERVRAEKHDVDGEDNRPYPDPERRPAVAVRPSRRKVDVIREQEEEDARDVEEVTVDVLQNQRELVLAPVALSRLAHRT